MPTDLGAGLKARGQQMWLKLRSFDRFPRTEWGAAKIPAKAVGDKNSGTVPKRLRDLLKSGPRIYPVPDNCSTFSPYHVFCSAKN